MPEDKASLTTFKPATMSGSSSVLRIEKNKNMKTACETCLQRYQIYMLATNLDEDPETRKVAILLHNIGPDGSENFNSFNSGQNFRRASCSDSEDKTNDSEILRCNREKLKKSKIRWCVNIESSKKLLNCVNDTEADVNVISYGTSLTLNFPESIIQKTKLTVKGLGGNNIPVQQKQLFEGLGCQPQECNITIREDVTPKVDAPREVPFKLRKQLKKELDRMEVLGVIQKVAKPNG
ncbi:hypothetical protein HHI36_022388 [Cryptolaemus montrouzieri]|uniref:Uncharacterized protein n=1 Tax=Cryptolaemus montrouzieri TaxID=559131 RepID=A0ABD2MZN0_9CUCU